MNDLIQYSELSYEYLTNLRKNFVKVGKEGYKKYDEPGFFFWKPLFYFFNGTDEKSGLGSAGLLHPSWSEEYIYKPVEDESNIDNSKPMNTNEDIIRDVSLPNSAYNYLLRNGELKRAQLLKNFINLLSEISSFTPWYFKEISGLEDAVSRKEFFNSPKIDETRKSITITCLADSVDTRIGNMLDMYKAACYSWQTKREIVPANLRKFDMGIYVYLQPTQRNSFNDIRYVSHKYLEFHNCEIDIDSCKFGDSFSIETPNMIEYKIVINYDNCYDNRYSNNILGLIGDAITSDFTTSLFDKENKDVDGSTLKDNIKHKDYTGVEKYGAMYDYDLTYDDNLSDDSDKTKSIKSIYNNIYGNKSYDQRKTSSGFLSNVINKAYDATAGTIEQAVKSGVGGLLWGNLYHGSLLNTASDIYQGNIISGTMDLVKNATDKKTYTRAVENLYGTIKEETSSRVNKVKKSAKNLGNIHKNKSIRNNI
jgi:hypothetical protein